MLTAPAKSQLTIGHRPSPVKMGSVWRKTTSSILTTCRLRHGKAAGRTCGAVGCGARNCKGNVWPKRGLPKVLSAMRIWHTNISNFLHSVRNKRFYQIFVNSTSTLVSHAEVQLAIVMKSNSYIFGERFHHKTGCGIVRRLEDPEMPTSQSHNHIPDMNPIENLWAILDRALRKKTYQTIL